MPDPDQELLAVEIRALADRAKARDPGAEARIDADAAEALAAVARLFAELAAARAPGAPAGRP